MYLANPEQIIGDDSTIESEEITDTTVSSLEKTSSPTKRADQTTENTEILYDESAYDSIGNISTLTEEFNRSTMNQTYTENDTSESDVVVEAEEEDGEEQQQTEDEQTPEENTVDPNYEYQFSFKSHVFEEDQQQNKEQVLPGDTHEELINLDPRDYCVDDEEQEFLYQVFKYLASQSGTVSVLNMLKLCRNCFLLRNWVSYRTILKEIQSVTNTDRFTGYEGINYQQFKKILLSVIRRKAKKTESDDIAAIFLTTVETNIKHFYRFTLLPDDLLDTLLQPDVLNCFFAQSTKLREIFQMYSSLVDHSLMSQQKKNTMRTNNTVSIAEFLAFTEAFELCPNLVPRHVLNKIILPRCRLSSDDIESYDSHVNSPSKKMAYNLKLSPMRDLNYPEFIEALGRIAIYVYSKYPYSDMTKTPADKIQMLFEALGFYDLLKFKRLFKRGTTIGSVIQPKERTTKPEISVKVRKSANQQNVQKLKAEKPDLDADRSKYEEFLRDEQKLKGMYLYCTCSV
jgi:hypothetical protein